MRGVPLKDWNDANRKVAQEATEPRISKELIEEQIMNVDYLMHGVTTICVITLQNGFKAVGTSTPAAEKNYMEDVGKRYAYENAFRDLWPVFGFSLKDRLQKHDSVREAFNDGA
jgi:hypothetical protein